MRNFILMPEMRRLAAATLLEIYSWPGANAFLQDEQHALWGDGEVTEALGLFSLFHILAS